MDTLQNNVTKEDFRSLRKNYNINLINFANIQSGFIKDIPDMVNQISRYTDRLSNITVIAGNCYHYKMGGEFKTVSSKNIEFNSEFNTFKLKPELSYTVEPKEGTSRIITNQSFSLRDSDTSVIKNLDDLLIRHEPITFITSENKFKYTLNLNFSSLKTFNNIGIKLGDKTLSYPNISEIYYIDNKNQKVSLEIINIGDYSIDLDLYRNSKNIYDINLESITSDNVYIVLEDRLESLTIEDLYVNYTEYTEEGEIILEALRESEPILKVGLEGSFEDNVNISVSDDSKDWYKIDLSNNIDINKYNKVVSFNTISPLSIKTFEDVKTLFIKIRIKAMKDVVTNQRDISKEIYRNPSFSVSNIHYTDYSLYKNTDSVFYGKMSTVNRMDYKDLYNNGEYILSNNNYFIKGFKESSISKTPISEYTYSPTSIKSKAVRKNGPFIKLGEIDISSKEVLTYDINPIKKNLLESVETEYVYPLKDSVIRGVYYIVQGTKEIPVDLSLGFINSAIDVLYVVKEDEPVYLLDTFKNVMEELTSFKENINEDLLCFISLLDSSLFESKPELSRTYPLINLNQYQIGLLDNKLGSNNLNQEVSFYELLTYPLYTQDIISIENMNYSNILSTKDYEDSLKLMEEVIPRSSKSFKFIQKGISKNGFSVNNKSLIQVPYINGYKEFLEYNSKDLVISIPEGLNSNEYLVELLETDIDKDSISFYSASSIDGISIELVEKNKSFLKISSKTNLPPLKIDIHYTYKNTKPKHYYSIDFENGLAHFSEILSYDLKVIYNYDQILVTGKSASQLVNKDFNLINKNFNVNSYEETSSIYFVYKNNLKTHRRITPILKDLKINYLIKDSLSL